MALELYWREAYERHWPAILQGLARIWNSHPIRFGPDL